VTWKLDVWRTQGIDGRAAGNWHASASVQLIVPKCACHPDSSATSQLLVHPLLDMAPLFSAAHTAWQT
jgi:hypothetical protein